MAKRKVIRRAGPLKLGELQVDYLLEGWCLDPGAPEDPVGFSPRYGQWIPFDSPEAMREAWFAHRAELMAEAARRGEVAWGLGAFEGESDE